MYEANIGGKVMITFFGVPDGHWTPQPNRHVLPTTSTACREEGEGDVGLLKK